MIVCEALNSLDIVREGLLIPFQVGIEVRKVNMVLEGFERDGQRYGFFVMIDGFVVYAEFLTGLSTLKFYLWKVGIVVKGPLEILQSMFIFLKYIYYINYFLHFNQF